MCTKKLPIAHSPITGLQCLAYPLVVALNYEECLPWFYSNYIQLEWWTMHYGKILQERLEFFTPNWVTDVPFFEYQVIKKQHFINNFHIGSDGIINLIEDGWYLNSFFDEFFVPDRSAYGKRHNEHDFLLYGYDIKEKTFALLGYTDKYAFETTTISFDAFAEAFKHTPLFYNVTLFRKNDKIQYDFDLKNVSDLLADYLYSRNSSERLRMFRNISANKTYGMEIYNCLKRFFTGMLADPLAFNFLPLHIFWEHKRCMLLRLEYMHKTGIGGNWTHAIDAYKPVESGMFLLRNMLLKYGISRNKKLLEDIILSLDELHCLEQEILEQVLNIL